MATVEKYDHQTAAALEHFRKARLIPNGVDDTKNEGQQEIYRSNLRLLGYYNAHVAPWVSPLQVMIPFIIVSNVVDIDS